MISTLKKKIIGIEKSIRPFNYRDKTGISKLVIFKGYEPHYQWFLQNQSSFNEYTKIYSYDRCSVDLALQMAFRNTTKLSYISTRNYQTVTAINRNTKKPEVQVKQQKPVGMFANTSRKSIDTPKKLIISNKISQKAIDILKNFEFVIQNTFLDIHPLEAYQKMCGYLMVRSDPAILQNFNGFKCSQSTLFQSFLILPILNQLRTKLLITDGQKLEKLQRRSDILISNETIKEYIQKWSSIVSIKTFQKSINSFDQKQKFQWVLNNNLGENISKQAILNQRYRKFSYAIFN